MRRLLQAAMVVAGLTSLAMVVHVLKTEANGTYQMSSGWALIAAFAIFSLSTIELAHGEYNTI